MSRASGSERRTLPLLLLAVAILLIAPRTARAQDDWFGPDKLLHFLGGFFVTSVSYTIVRAHFEVDHDQALAIGVGAAVVASIGKEVWDGLSGRGDPSGKDLFWDGIGIGVGVAFVNLLREKADYGIHPDELVHGRVGLGLGTVGPLRTGLNRGLFPLPRWSPSGPFPAARNPLTIPRAPVP
jgi:uncharacterized protein YfiM (DUF2279 family)